MTRLERSLVLVRTVITARSAGEPAYVDDAQRVLDHFDREHGYDRRRNTDLGPIPQDGQKMPPTSRPQSSPSGYGKTGSPWKQ